MNFTKLFISIFSFAILLLVSTCTNANVTGQTPESAKVEKKYCEDSFIECENKTVRYVGVLSKFIMNHILEGPLGFKNNYLIIHGSEVVVYTKDKLIACKPDQKIEVIGVLKKVTGSRGYEGYHITATNWQCRN